MSRSTLTRGILLACLICIGHGRRVQTIGSKKQAIIGVRSDARSLQQVRASNLFKALARSLLAFTPVAKWPSSLAELASDVMSMASSAILLASRARTAMSKYMYLVQPAAWVALLLLFNVHYLLLGRPFFAEGFFTARPVLGSINTLSGILIKSAMIKQGVPKANRAETYSSGGGRSKMDVFEPEEGAASNTPRPAMLYFHAGAWIFGHRSMGAGTCSWLASHGVVCFSITYRRTNSGAGVAGCIEDAWAALRWVRANAKRLNVDPSRIFVVGDSGGGLLATALGTGLDPKRKDPAEHWELPAAVIGGWPVTALGSRTFIPHRAKDGKWKPTVAAKDFPVANVFVPPEYGHSAEATQARIREVMANRFLLFGRRLFGLLPASRRFPADDGASLSPLSLARRSGLPPMLLLCGEADEVVPCAQSTHFAETARSAGNAVAQLIFKGAGHGGGGLNCATGRKAALRFLRHHKLLEETKAREDDPHDAMGGAIRAFNLKPANYKSLQFRPSVHGHATMCVKPVK